MIVGIGTDILYMKHLAPDCLKEGDSFLQKVYSEKEVEHEHGEVMKLKIDFYY